MVQDFIGYTYEPRRRALARQIVQHVAKCLETESLSVVTRLVFALNCVRFELKESREDETESQKQGCRVRYRMKVRDTLEYIRRSVCLILD